MKYIYINSNLLCNLKKKIVGRAWVGYLGSVTSTSRIKILIILVIIKIDNS